MRTKLTPVEELERLEIARTYLNDLTDPIAPKVWKPGRHNDRSGAPPLSTHRTHLSTLDFERNSSHCQWAQSILKSLSIPYELHQTTAMINFWAVDEDLEETQFKDVSRLIVAVEDIPQIRGRMLGHELGISS